MNFGEWTFTVDGYTICLDLIFSTLMKNATYFYLFLLLFWSCSAFTQNMEEGFKALETGDFVEAERFFSDILQSYPDNKTAQLCYARAIGLNGKPAEAKARFSNLLNKFPGDFELELNYAESLLWNEEYKEAKSYYEKLLDKDPNSFPAVLGYANTLSNLKEFQLALAKINAAIQLLPENENAKISRKYIRLGLANDLIKKSQNEEAWSLYQENLNDFPNDKDTLLNMFTWCIINEDFERGFNVTESISQFNTNTAIINNSLLFHLKGQEKKALNTISPNYSESLLSDLNNTADTKIIERYVQALIWNEKYDQADLIISELENLESSTWIIALRATYNTYLSNFKNSLDDYSKILTIDSTSFDGNLGSANAFKALRKFNNAYEQAEKAARIYEGQKDVIGFIQNLDNQFKPNIEAQYAYNFDNGDNEANVFSANTKIPFSSKWNIVASYASRKTNNTVTNIEAETSNFNAGLNLELTPAISLQTILGVVNGESENNTFTQLNANLKATVRPFKMQVIDLGFLRNVQDFNTDLIANEIITNNYFINYNIATNKRFGAFLQYFYTSQSDNNTRNLFFGSLFYNILKKPSLKVGINYQTISFKEQRPTIYFSPSKFNAYEVFFNLIKPLDISKSNEWFYELSAATGLQKIASNDTQGTYRFQGNLGYKFSERFNLKVFGTHSNIASTTAAGFTFTELGVKAHWDLTKRPLFKTKKAENQ